MPSYLRQQKFPFGSLRTDPHWSTKNLTLFSQSKPAGLYIDETPNKNHGTLIGSPVWVGNGLLIDAADDRVSIPAGVVADQGTFLMWFIGSGTPSGTGKLVRSGNSNEFLVGRVTDSSLSFNFNNVGAMAISSPVAIWGTGNINLIAVTWDIDTNERKGYINGILGGTDGTAIGTPTITIFNLGNRTSGGHQVGGVIVGTMFYSRVLTVSEIQELYINFGLLFQQRPAWWGQIAAAPTGFKPYWTLNNNRLVGTM